MAHSAGALLAGLVQLAPFDKLSTGGFMTNEQLKMLRSVIQGEIEAAIMAENDYRFVHEQEHSNDQAWETLAQSFGRIDAPSNWHQ
jgi:hypothetical protein